MVAIVDYPVLYQREMELFSCLVLSSDKAFFA